MDARFHGLTHESYCTLCDKLVPGILGSQKIELHVNGGRHRYNTPPRWLFERKTKRPETIGDATADTQSPEPSLAAAARGTPTCAAAAEGGAAAAETAPRLSTEMKERICEATGGWVGTKYTAKRICTMLGERFKDLPPRWWLSFGFNNAGDALAEVLHVNMTGQGGRRFGGKSLQKPRWAGAGATAVAVATSPGSPATSSLRQGGGGDGGGSVAVSAAVSLHEGGGLAPMAPSAEPHDNEESDHDVDVRVGVPGVAAFFAGLLRHLCSGSSGGNLSAPATPAAVAAVVAAATASASASAASAASAQRILRGKKPRWPAERKAAAAFLSTMPPPPSPPLAGAPPAPDTPGFNPDGGGGASAQALSTSSKNRSSSANENGDSGGATPTTPGAMTSSGTKAVARQLRSQPHNVPKTAAQEGTSAESPTPAEKPPCLRPPSPLQREDERDAAEQAPTLNAKEGHANSECKSKIDDDGGSEMPSAGSELGNEAGGGLSKAGGQATGSAECDPTKGKKKRRKKRATQLPQKMRQKIKRLRQCVAEAPTPEEVATANLHLQQCMKYSAEHRAKRKEDAAQAAVAVAAEAEAALASNIDLDEDDEL